MHQILAQIGVDFDSNYSHYIKNYLQEQEHGQQGLDSTMFTSVLLYLVDVYKL